MGQTPTEIELDVERQRHALTARVSRLDRRVRDDIENTKDRVSSHVAEVKHSIASSGESAVKKVGNVAGTTAGSGTAVAEHPKTLVGTAAASGFALGLVRSGSDEQEHRPEEHARDEQSRNQTRHGPRLGHLADVARGFVAAQAANLVDAAMGTAKSSLKSAVTGKTDRPNAGYPRDGERDRTVQASEVQTAHPAQLNRGTEQIIRDEDKAPSQSHEAVVDPFTA